MWRTKLRILATLLAAVLLLSAFTAPAGGADIGIQIAHRLDEPGCQCDHHHHGPCRERLFEGNGEGRRGLAGHHR